MICLKMALEPLLFCMRTMVGQLQWGLLLLLGGEKKTALAVSLPSAVTLSYRTVRGWLAEDTGSISPCGNAGDHLLVAVLGFRPECYQGGWGAHRAFFLRVNFILNMGSVLLCLCHLTWRWSFMHVHGYLCLTKMTKPSSYSSWGCSWERRGWKCPKSWFVLHYKEHTTNLQMYLESLLRMMQLVHLARENQNIRE